MFFALNKQIDLCVFSGFGLYIDQEFWRKWLHDTHFCTTRPGVILGPLCMIILFLTSATFAQKLEK